MFLFCLYKLFKTQEMLSAYLQKNIAYNKVYWHVVIHLTYK